ncbi:MAG TPA: phosphotransferase [Holophaga sp.]|nr:phosphotransferase [Holophaga sp.]
MNERLTVALERWACTNARPLVGDAGARQYFRVDHSTLGTALVVLYPDPDPEKPDDPYYDYRALQAYLDPVVRVPTTIQFWDEGRAMLLEDLGDVSLEQRLVQHPEEENRWAAEIGEQLSMWMGLLTEAAPSRAFFMLRSFDKAKFEFEWEYCRQNFFQDFLQKDPPGWLDRMMVEVHGALESRARFLVHRDFHVRNLMVHGDRLVTIDFQDARKGAATYDLASILFDGYWDWSEEARQIMVERALETLGWSEVLLWEELNLSALQRNLKALGTFGHQIVHRKRCQFAPAIPRTIRHLIHHFHRMRHGEGVIATENWLRWAEARLLSCREGA